MVFFIHGKQEFGPFQNLVNIHLNFWVPGISWKADHYFFLYKCGILWWNPQVHLKTRGADRGTVLSPTLLSLPYSSFFFLSPPLSLSPLTVFAPSDYAYSRQSRRLLPTRYRFLFSHCCNFHPAFPKYVSIIILQQIAIKK